MNDILVGNIYYKGELDRIAVCVSSDVKLGIHTFSTYSTKLKHDIKLIYAGHVIIPQEAIKANYRYLGNTSTTPLGQLKNFYPEIFL